MTNGSPRAREANGLQHTQHTQHAPQSYSITVVCNQHENHGPYNFNGQDDLIISNSRVLGRLISTGEHHIHLDYSGRKYGCSTLLSIIQTWKSQEYHPLVQGNTFAALSQLSKALWEYQCCPKWFRSFATEIRNQHWTTHFRHGGHSETWALIALVFGWEDVFGLASMDIPSLGMQPHRSQGSHEHGQIAQIVGEKDYIDQVLSTYEFVRNRCGALIDTNRPVFDRLIRCFQDNDIAILTSQEANVGIIRPLGVVGLLRMVESFLERDIEPPNERGTPNYRFPHKPFMWKMAAGLKHRLTSQAAESTSIQGSMDPAERDLLSQTRQHRESSLSHFLERNGDAGRRFRNLRSNRLLLHDESPNSNRVSSIVQNTSPREITPAEPLRQELPGSLNEVYKYTTPDCLHSPGLIHSSGGFPPSGDFHSPGCLQSSSSFYHPGVFYPSGPSHSPDIFRPQCSCRPASPPL